MDAFDRQIKRSLKQWVAQHTPPSDGRARLLTTIMSTKAKAEKPASFQFAEIPNEFLSWTMAYNLERGVAALRLVS